jgi:hypothetical protein
MPWHATIETGQCTDVINGDEDDIIHYASQAIPFGEAFSDYCYRDTKNYSTIGYGVTVDTAVKRRNVMV